MVTPLGNEPERIENLGLGNPEATRLKLPVWPDRKVASLAEVIAGAWLTVSVNDWVASVPTPLAALMVMR